MKIPSSPIIHFIRLFDNDKVMEIAMKTGLLKRKKDVLPSIILKVFTLGLLNTPNPSLNQIAAKCEEFQPGLSISKEAIYKRLEKSSLLIFVAICAGAVGSASGGIQIAFNSLKNTFVAMGVNLEYVHRIGVIAAGTLDTFPHQGAQITLLNLCHLTHKEGYFDIFITQIVIPILTLFIVIPLCVMGL